jgi:thioredoxin 1
MTVIDLKDSQDLAGYLEDSILWMSAPWCSPCKAIAPVMNQISDSRQVVKVDIDQFTDIAQEYGIQSIPVIIDFADGKEINRIIGAKPKAVLLREFVK